MKRKLVLCFLVFALLLSGMNVMAVKISDAKSENASGAVITEQNDQSFKVTYTGQKDKEYVLMAVGKDGIDSSVQRPTKETIGNNQAGVVVYMDQATGNADGKVEFNVHPNLDQAKTGDEYFIYISSNEANSGMSRVGSFTIEELLALLGDLNGDGVLDVKDRAFLTRYLAHWDGYNVELSAGDLNNDGAVDVKDRAILTRYLAHWDGYATLPYKP